jgi:predicted molibdopterin-dependent oxidoreductase YjgC
MCLKKAWNDILFEAAKLFATAGRSAIYWGMGITQHSHGTDNAKAIVNLALITGNIGYKGGGVNPLRGQNNVQGASDMGALPHVFTGYQNITDEDVRDKFARCWGVGAEKLDPNNGLALTQIIDLCGDQIKVLYIVGENPLISEPNLDHAEKQIEKLNFLVVQDIFLTETAELADVVLPGVAFAEKTGTFTNTERRVQLSRQALEPPVGTRQDYEIIADIAKRLGDEKFPRTPEDLFEEIRTVTPLYYGMTYKRLEGKGLQWPCPSEDHAGTPFVHADGIERGKGLLSALAYRPPAEETDEEYPLVLNTGRLLYHWHTGSMTRRARVLDGIVPDGYVELNFHDGEKYGIADGEMIKVSSRRGSITIRANLTDRVAQGALFIPFHFAEAAANRLTNNVLDPVSKIPEYKVCAVRVEKFDDGSDR